MLAMVVVSGRVPEALFAVEGHEQQAEGVQRRDEHADRTTNTA
jgi:hypothetical protein